MLKQISLIFRTEKSNKGLLLCHLGVLIPVIYLILQFFGSYYGEKSKKAEGYMMPVTIHIDGQINAEQFDVVQAVDGFVYGKVVSKETIETDFLHSDMRIISIFGDFPYNLQIIGENPLRNESDSLICLPYSYAKTLNIEIGCTVELGGKRFTVCGTTGTATEDCALASYSVLCENFSPEKIIVYLDSYKYSEDETSSSISFIEKTLGARAEYPSFETLYQSKLEDRLTDCIVYFALASIIIGLVYSYILYRRRKLYAIYSLCGATRKLLLVIMGLGNTVIYTVGFILAYFLGLAVNKLFISRLFDYNTYFLTAENIAVMYLLMLGVYVAVMTFNARRFLKSSVAESYQRRSV